MNASSADRPKNRVERLALTILAINRRVFPSLPPSLCAHLGAVDDHLYVLPPAAGLLTVCGSCARQVAAHLPGGASIARLTVGSGRTVAFREFSADELVHSN